MPVAPPRPKGPQLTALRAFEAAARTGGFAAAADELCVTPGAISQQVRALEDWAGAALFERQSQGVQLTRLGAEILSDTTRAFDLLGQVQRQIRHGADHPGLAIAALPAVAQVWLVPRLPAIRAALPGNDISITALEQPPNLARELFDLTLFIDAPEKGDVVLARDRLIPVCRPEIAEMLRTPPDLLGESLLHDSTWTQDWPLWMEAAGVSAPALLPGPRHSLYALALEEARQGSGVLIGHAALLEREIGAGRLVAPFPIELDQGHALVARLAKPASPVAKRVLDLLAA
ncbi:LysR family transcriptional regulator [Aliiruegeria sabulilitoris]|uniref:LysR family transcriptional regulator n=1 Tax=Aliiruegeria sabulilitoris TaxID=1510458 RepID=UPI00082F4227|nr:LysR family transcriptional regulator [Aliiruegeria sabulilitoris]NDR55802.1 LysR family transcriptional regulator [Pseudoruegeria sp. M32A2M]